jgi:hypothetical protein
MGITSGAIARRPLLKDERENGLHPEEPRSGVTKDGSAAPDPS